MAIWRGYRKDRKFGQRIFRKHTNETARPKILPDQERGQQRDPQPGASGGQKDLSVVCLQRT